jgi:hypothetical protein
LLIQKLIERSLLLRRLVFGSHFLLLSTSLYDAAFSPLGLR